MFLGIAFLWNIPKTPLKKEFVENMLHETGFSVTEGNLLEEVVKGKLLHETVFFGKEGNF